MKMTFAGFSLFIVLLFNILSCSKTENTEIEHEKEELTDGIRIAWDYATLKRVAPLPGRSPGYYGYARMIQLHDGRLACVYETSEGNVELTVSTDMGKSWKWPKTIFQTVNNITMAVPSILELNDQSLLVACNPRPREPYTDDRKFGIKVRKSIDGGATWMPEQTVYEAQSTFNDGCWEPAMVQLSGGEVQLYFSNEGIYTRSNEQDISLLRSFDLGETWTTEPEVAGFRKSRRDGMPVPLLLADRGELLISIEDNKAGEFKPSIYREKISDNWSGGFIGADDPRRTYHPLSDPLPLDIYAGGPYLARLHSGEVLLSYQTTLDRNKVWNYSSMAVEIGDSEGRLYSRRSVPFSMPVSKWGLWNSLAVIGDDVPVAITSTNAFSANSTEVWMITGRIIPEFPI
ncbi:MAG: exo-alpha-sialidase, partial [Bacteroidales bacterium]|nr:exo-alpha-sialidase [Bacteroidales bacterium]